MTAQPRSTAQAKGGGLLFGIGAYVSWGLFPAFFPLLKPAGALEVLAHRIVWTLVLMAAVLVVMRRLVGPAGASTGAPGCCWCAPRCWCRATG